MSKGGKREIVFSSSTEESEEEGQIIVPPKRKEESPKQRSVSKPPANESSEESIHIDEDNEEEEEDIAPIQIVHQSVQPMTTFGFSKETKKSLFNAKYKFSMHLDGEVKYWASTKTRYPKGKVPIYEGSETTEFSYYLIVGNSCSMFSLRNKANESEDLMTMSIMNDASLLRLPRRSNVYILEGLGVPPLELASRQPSKSARGNWILNFEKRYVIPSVKNTVLYEKRIGERNGSDLLMMRKIGKKAFELDVTGNIPMIAVFAVGLSLSLSK